MGLCAEVVYLVRLYLLDDASQVGGVGQVAVVEDEPLVVYVRVLIKMIYTLGIERGGAALDAVDFVAFIQQKFSQIRAILPRNASNYGLLHRNISYKNEMPDYTVEEFWKCCILASHHAKLWRLDKIVSNYQ